MNDREINEKVTTELLEANFGGRSILSEKELNFITPYVNSFVAKFGGETPLLIGFAVVLFRLGMLYSKRYANFEPIRLSINERN